VDLGISQVHVCDVLRDARLDSDVYNVSGYCDAPTLQLFGVYYYYLLSFPVSVRCEPWFSVGILLILSGFFPLDILCVHSWLAYALRRAYFLGSG
jgi:hypothetical protein